MSTETTFPYTDAANYTLADAEIVAGKVQLEVEDAAGETFDEDFADDTGFTLEDSVKAEITGGQAQQVDQRLADETLWATFQSSVDLTYGGGVLTGNPVNGASVTGGKLDLRGGAGTDKHVYWPAVGNADSQQVGAVRFKYVPNYSGAPAASQFIWFNQRGDTDKRNCVRLRHSATTGEIHIYMTDSADVIVEATDLGAWNPTAGTEYEFELNWDLDAGAHRLFIDGVQFGATMTGTGTRDSNIGSIACGINPTGATLAADFQIDDLVHFPTVQHTSGYAPGYSLSETIYLESYVQLPEFAYAMLETIQALTGLTTSEANSPRYSVRVGSGSWRYWDGAAWSISDGSYAQAASAANTNANLATHPDASGGSAVTVRVHFGASNSQMSVSDLSLEYTGRQYVSTGTAETNTTLSASAVSSFAATETAAGGTVRHGLRVSGTLKWWNGSAWADSDGSAGQLNAAADVNANLGDLSLGATGEAIKVYTRLTAPGSQLQTPDLDQVVVAYSFEVVDPSEIATCRVFGTVTDVEDEPISGVIVTVERKTTKDTDISQAVGRIVYQGKQVTTGADGEFSFNLIPTARFDGALGTYLLSLRSDRKQLVSTVDGRRIELTVPEQPEYDITDLITVP